MVKPLQSAWGPFYGVGAKRAKRSPDISDCSCPWTFATWNDLQVH